MIKNDIVNLIKPILEREDLSTDNFSVEVSTHADYATNIALRVGRFKDYQTSEQVAKVFVASLPENDMFFEPKIVQPGFINFTLKPGYIHKNIQKIIEEGENFGSSFSNKNKKARVEFVSANPTGPLHIGNARGGPLGDTLALVLERTGYQVIREYYNNNIGTQVDIFGDSLNDLIKKKFGSKESITDKHNQRYEGTYMEDLANKIIEELKILNLSDVERNKNTIKGKGIEILFSEITNICHHLGIEFNEVFNENEVQEKFTSETIKELSDKGLTKEKDGAVWFAPKDEFLEDRESVLVRADGRFTYFADDIAYHKIKFKTKPDLIINVLGSNHHGHVPRLKAAIQALGEDVNKFIPILYQYVRVKRGNDIVKMSKRAGNFVTAEEVLEEVGKEAFRFFMLQHSPNTHMDFDLELAKAKNESNPVYYVQYAHARICSILEKSKDIQGDVDLSLLKEKEELNLAKKILQLPDLVLELSENFQVHQLTYFAMEVADLFHKFYESQRVISNNMELTKARLELTLAVKITLNNTLRILGVSAPQRM